ncbi:MAG: PhzF family phenazine biosynthesis protein [Candidatus Hodarchaeota archaeon]
MDMGILIYQVDAFTEEPFKGNPAAVCICKKQYSDEVLQLIAAEMNLSETAFIRNQNDKPPEGSDMFSLRWFTPKTEVPLCGHATLASALVLFNDFKIPQGKVIFCTKSGKLTARKEEGNIALDFPRNESVPTNPDKDLLKAVGVTNFKSAHVSKSSRKLLIHARNEKELLSLRPDFERMKSIHTSDDVWGVIVTAEGHPPYDFVSRFFAPWVGINEDPVTGAAHTVLAPYWSKILGKHRMHARQASARGGEMTVVMRPNNRVDLIGKGVIISKGRLFL